MSRERVIVVNIINYMYYGFVGEGMLSYCGFVS